MKNLVEQPYSRRHIMSFWNWQNIKKKNLWNVLMKHHG
jgi:thymidylate synthase